MRPETLGALREKPEVRVIRERVLEAARGGAAPACPCIPFLTKLAKGRQSCAGRTAGAWRGEQRNIAVQISLSL